MAILAVSWLSQFDTIVVDDFGRCELCNGCLCVFQVYKHPYSDHYIIFGEAKVEETDHNEALSHLKAMERIRQLNLSDPDANESGPMSRAGDLGLAKSKIEEEPEEEEGEVDETGVDSGDVNLVMAQSGATRRQAVNALKKHGGDVVNGNFVLSPVLSLVRFPIIVYFCSNHGDDFLMQLAKGENSSIIFS